MAKSSVGSWTDQNEGMKMPERTMKTGFTKLKILNSLQLAKKRLMLPVNIAIIKTLAESQLVYIMSSLETK